MKRTMLYCGIRNLMIKLIWISVLMGIGVSGVAFAETTLTVYSGRGEQFTRPILDAFTQLTGITVRLQTGRSAALLAKLREEGAHSPADVFITNYVGVLEEARKHELLTPCTSPLVTEIPPEFRAWRFRPACE